MRNRFKFLLAYLILGFFAFLMIVGAYLTLYTISPAKTAHTTTMAEVTTAQSKPLTVLTEYPIAPQAQPPWPDPTPAPTKALQAPTTAPEWVTYKVTAYCACARCCGKTDGITASGTKAKQGRTVAADPKVLPYGTVIEIEGVGVRTVEDCGAFRGLRLDLFYNDHADALQWGVRSRRVRVISYGR